MPAPIPDFDLYAELEVSRRASTETIEAAWRSLMKRNHPDSTAVSGTLARAKRLNVAHDWLADPQRRARYDAVRPSVAPRRTRTTADRASTKGQTSQNAAPERPQPEPQPQPAPTPETPGAAPEGWAAHQARSQASTGWSDRVGSLDFSRTGRIVITPLAVIGGLRLLWPGGTESAFNALNPTDAPAFTIAPTGPSTTSPSGSPITLTGSGNRDKMSLQLAGGSYSFVFRVVAPPATACSWMLYVTEAGAGYEQIVAQAFPLAGEVDNEAERQPGMAAGEATARVASDCPSWSVSVSLAAP